MVLILVWFGFIVLDSYLHYRLIEKGRDIYHDVSGLYRTLVAVALWMMLGEGSLPGLMYFLLAAFFSFWTIFNLSLNKLRGLSWSYLGKSSFLDRLESKSREGFFSAWTIVVLKITISAHLIGAYINL